MSCLYFLTDAAASGTFKSMNAAKKIPAVKITIVRAEGPAALCKSRWFGSFAAASKALLKAAHTYPKTGGYDKHDLEVKFADGEIYKGRLDCKANGEDCNVAAHVREALEFSAGARKPLHMTDERYSAMLRREPADVAEALAFLATYEIGDSSVTLETSPSLATGVWAG